MNFHPLTAKRLVTAAYIISAVANSVALADFLPPSPSPYSFGPEGRPIETIQQFGKPVDMANFLPNRPVAAKDKYGNREYFSPSGRMIVSIAQDGRMTFSISGKSVQKDAEGKVISTTERIRGTNRSEIKNDKGEIIGYQEIGFGNKVTHEYDAHGNLTKTYVYDTYGKSTQWLINELTLTKTVFDKTGTAQYDQNFEGAIVARYSYDKFNRLQNKTDLYGNKTYFDDRGNSTYSEDMRGQKISQYYYKTDEEGRHVLEKMEDLTPGINEGNVTYFENGQAQYTRSRFGGIAQEYHYDGHTLQYVFDTRSNETTWYDLNGKATHTTFNGYVTKEWLYYQARLVGYYDHYQKTVSLFQYERQDQVAKVYAKENVPTADEIEKYYEKTGMMTDVAASQILPSAGRKAIMRKSNIFKTYARGTNFIMDLVRDAKADVTAPNTVLQESKSNYSLQTGKLESVVTRNPDDPTGWITDFHVDPTVTITVSGDQAANKGLADQLLQRILESGQNIGTISAGNSDLAAFARSIKTMTVRQNKISKLSDEQIRNIFGWNKDGAVTQTCIADVRARTANAGNDGTVSITFGFGAESAGSPLYAAAISASDSNEYIVAGLESSRLLDLSGQDARDGVLVSAGQTGNLPNFPIGNDTAAQAAQTAYSPSARVQTVNGVTRIYAANGTIISQVDSITGEKTEFDAFGRKKHTYSGDGILLKSYSYANDGSMQSTKAFYIDQATGNSGYTTTFFVGWGAAENDQPSITVEGDQTANASLAAKLWSAITGGTGISDIASDNASPTLSSFAKTVKAITVNPSIILHITDGQASNILGLAVSGQNLAELKKWAAKVGAEGTFSITYNADNDKIFATQIQVFKGTRAVASLSLSSLLPGISSTANTLLQQTGLTYLSNAAVSISASLTGMGE